MKLKNINIKKKIKQAIVIILAIITSIFCFIGILKKESIESQMVAFSPDENNYAINYQQYLDGDDIVDGTNGNVRFSAFFLRDLNGDGIAERYYGACNHLSNRDSLYFDINVSSDGIFKNGRITINGKNFKLAVAIPSDSEFPDTYISSDLKYLEFNDIVNGMSKFFYGTTSASIPSSNINYYSRDDNKVTLTGIYVDSEGVEHEVLKEIQLKVDYYGNTRTDIVTGTKVYNDLDSRKREDLGTLNLTMTFTGYELNEQLIIKSNHFEGTIPSLNGYMPTSVSITNSNCSVNYNAETGKFIIEKQAEVNENGNVTQNGYTSYSYINGKSYRVNSYTLDVRYPMEAYEMLNEADKQRIKLQVPVEEYYECFNNPDSEFTDISKSNIVKGICKFEYYQYIPSQNNVYPESIDVRVGYYVREPYYDYIIPKRKALRIYNGSTLPSNQDYYNVYWSYYSGTYGNDKMITLSEKNRNLGKVSDEFLRKNNSIESMEEYQKTNGVFFTYSGQSKHGGNFLKPDGEIRIYDDDNDILLLSVDASTIDNYKSDSMFTFDEPVSHIRVEIENYYSDSRVYIYSVKELDNDNIYLNHTVQEFLNLSKVRTHLVAYAGEELLDSRTHSALYPEQFSKATLGLTFQTISTQFTVKNQKLTIVTMSENDYSNRLGWHDGYFLIKIPNEILDVQLNGVTVNNNKMEILSYEYFKNEQGQFIKVITKNLTNSPQEYSVVVDTTITADPTIATKTVNYLLYSYNDEGTLFNPETQDIYDVNNNGITTDMVNNASTSITLLSPNSIITNQKLSEFDKLGTEVITPQVADVSPTFSNVDNEMNTAKISIQLKNNYSMNCTDIAILGRMPFEGNRDILKGTDLESDFTTQMIEDGIILPERFRDVGVVYYSENGMATRDLTNESNGWMLIQDITDFSKIKSYLIVLNNARLETGQLEVFSYRIKIPQNISINAATYSQHVVYYSLITPNGKYESNVESNKMGIKISQKYNLNVSKYQMHQNKLLEGATYKVEEVFEDGSVGEAKTGMSDENGIIVFENLYV